MRVALYGLHGALGVFIRPGVYSIRSGHTWYHRRRWGQTNAISEEILACGAWISHVCVAGARLEEVSDIASLCWRVGVRSSPRHASRRCIIGQGFKDTPRPGQLAPTHRPSYCSEKMTRSTFPRRGSVGVCPIQGTA